MRSPSTVGSTGSSQPTAPTTQTGATTATQGGHTIQPTRGQQIKRNIANFFSKIGQAFQKLHGRVQAHQAQQKLAANTRAAEGAAKNVLKALGKDSTEAKLSALLPNLLAKAAKLSPGNPVGKAAELLNNAALAAGKGSDIEHVNWKAMEPAIERILHYRMGRGQAVTQVIADLGMGDTEDIATDDQIDSMKAGVKSLLSVLQQKTDLRTAADQRSNAAETAKQAMQTTLAGIKTAPTFAAKLGHLSDALDTYLGGPGVNRGVVFRSDSAVTKAIAELLKSTDAAVSGRLADELEVALGGVDSEGVPDAMIDGHNKLRDGEVTGEQFEKVLNVATNLMTQLIGGTSEGAISNSANRVPTQTVQILQLIDAKVREHFPGDEGIAANAFVGSMFLRFQVPMISVATTELEGSKKEKAIARLANTVALSAFNAAAQGQATVKTDRFLPEVATAYEEFVSDYSDSIQRFRAAVLARDVD